MPISPVKRIAGPGGRVQVLVLLMAVLACGQQAPKKGDNPISWSIEREKAAGETTPIVTGGEFNARISAKIKDGWHLYSTEEPASGPRPTVISVPKGQPFEMSGDIDSPIPISAMDQNFGVKTEYYERSATFVIPIRVTGQAPSGPQKLLIEVRYQSCSDQLCLPPKTEKLELTVELKSGK